MQWAERESLGCDLFLAIGSSLVVFPAAGFPLLAKQNGAKLVILNREATELDVQSDLVIHDEIGPVLGEVLGRLLGEVLGVVVGDGVKRGIATGTSSPVTVSKAGPGTSSCMVSTYSATLSKKMLWIKFGNASSAIGAMTISVGFTIWMA